jgi:hypothetical protein
MKKLLKLATGSHPGKAVGETPSAPGAGEALPERRNKEDSSRPVDLCQPAVRCADELKALVSIFALVFCDFVRVARGGPCEGRWG